MLEKIVSGAQTGADRAGLAAAKHLGLKTGGWCTRDCRTESGKERHLIALYGLTETDNYSYVVRTYLNVRDSDATVLFGDDWSPGSFSTKRDCKALGKECLVNPTKEEFLAWLIKHKVKVLNVAGNRESKKPGIYDSTFKFLIEALNVPT